MKNTHIYTNVATLSTESTINSKEALLKLTIKSIFLALFAITLMTMLSTQLSY